MTRELTFALISILIFMIGMVPYTIDVIRWKTLPHPYSYGVWALILGVNTSVLIFQWEYIGSLPGIIITLQNMFLCLYGIYSAHRIPIRIFDKICLILALWAFIYGILSRDFFHTILLTILIDILAYLPSVKKWWILPWSETNFAWFLTWVNNTVMLFAIEKSSFETLGFWIYNASWAYLFCLMILFRRCYLKWWHSIFE